MATIVGAFRRRLHRGALHALVLAALVLAQGCAGQRSAAPAGRPAAALELILAALPARLADRDGWAHDLAADFAALRLPVSTGNVCAVVAVIAQESGFEVDPIVPGLGAIAWREIDRRAASAGVPPVLVHGVLELRSDDGRSYAERIDRARTEKELSDIFEDFTGSVPLGRRLFEHYNPIRTRGPMQVNVAFAERFEAIQPYPHPVAARIADELFTRRASLYFGTAHLLAYPAAYDRWLYRFADYNAGQYASRNAAFQEALGSLAGVPLVPDGALMPRDADPAAPGATERAALRVAARLGLEAAAVRKSLELGRTPDFESTALYQRIRARARTPGGRAFPYAVVPRIELEGPKLHTQLTTDWYAHRVEERFNRCMSRSAAAGSA